MNSIYDGNGIMHQQFQKREIIMNLREVTFCMVEELSKEIEVTKNRYGDRKIDSCKNVEFGKVKLSEIEDNIPYIRNKYFGKNIWLLLNE